MNDDDPLSQIPAHDRVSIPAILIVEGDDSFASPIAAGIDDPVIIPVTIDADSVVMMGDCFTENVTAVFIPDDDDGLDDGWPGQSGADGDPMGGDAPG